MKEWLNSLLRDEHNGSVSSKRLVTIMAFLFCGFAFLVDLFSDRTVSPALFDSMMYIVVAGLGFTASEKFANKKE
jgi:hypothetical protein